MSKTVVFNCQICKFVTFLFLHVIASSWFLKLARTKLEVVRFPRAVVWKNQAPARTTFLIRERRQKIISNYSFERVLNFRRQPLFVIRTTGNRKRSSDLALSRAIALRTSKITVVKLKSWTTLLLTIGRLTLQGQKRSCWRTATIIIIIFSNILCNASTCDTLIRTVNCCCLYSCDFKCFVKFSLRIRRR